MKKILSILTKTLFTIGKFEIKVWYLLVLLLLGVLNNNLENGSSDKIEFSSLIEGTWRTHKPTSNNKGYGTYLELTYIRVFENGKEGLYDVVVCYPQTKELDNSGWGMKYISSSKNKTNGDIEYKYHLWKSGSGNTSLKNDIFQMNINPNDSTQMKLIFLNNGQSWNLSKYSNTTQLDSYNDENKEEILQTPYCNPNKVRWSDFFNIK